MPVQTGKTGNRCWMRWGKAGKQYFYECGNAKARSRARRKAIDQGKAIHARRS